MDCAELVITKLPEYRAPIDWSIRRTHQGQVEIRLVLAILVCDVTQFVFIDHALSQHGLDQEVRDFDKYIVALVSDKVTENHTRLLWVFLERAKALKRQVDRCWVRASSRVKNICLNLSIE